MATITFVSDGDPYPALAGNPLTNTATRLFPGNPYAISDQTYNYTFNYRGGTNTINPHEITLGAMGIALNGVTMFSPLTPSSTSLPGSAVSPPPGFVWNVVHNSTAFGVDSCGGYPEANGRYRYQSGSFLINGWMGNALFYGSNAYFNDTAFGIDHFRHADGHSKIVGYMFDGYPVYGPYAYINATSSSSGTRQMLSSYRKKATAAPGRTFSYSQYSAGTFIQDYEYINNLGTLDQYNGRFCHTPDFPTGTYAYFLTFESGNFSAPSYPYIVGSSTREQRPVGGV